VILAWFVTLEANRAVAALPQTTEDDSATVSEITTIQAVLRLPREEADRALRVRVSGTVTFVQTSTLDFFVQSGEHAIWVSSTAGERLQRGDVVEVRGVTGAGAFAPELHPDAEGVSVLGSDALPIPASIEQLAFANGEHDCRFVSLTGVVRLVTDETHHLRITLATAFGRVPVLVPRETAGGLGTALVGAQIAARGVCSVDFNRRGQMTGMRVFAQESEDLRVLTPAREFVAVPSVSIARLLMFRSVIDRSGRTRTKGIVTLRRGDGSFFMTAEGASALVRPTSVVELRPGQEVEVIGFARADATIVTIEDAIVTRGPSGARPFARRITSGEELATDVGGGDLVRVEGRIEAITQRERETIIIARLDRTQDSADAESGLIADAVLELRLANAEVARWPAEMEVGARISAVGVKWPVVSALVGDAWPLVLVDSAEDIELIEAAPVLSTSRTLILIGIVALGGVLLAIVARARLVQKERIQRRLELAVAERTAELEAASRRIAAFDAVRSRFVALANHELRSPLMVLRMRGELLSREASPTTRVHGGDIVRCADRISNIIDEFLDKPLEQGQPRIATDRVNLSDLARAAVARAEPMLRAKGQRMVLDGTVRGVPAWGDARLIGAVLDNLLSNASKFSASGTEVRVSVRQSEEGSVSSVSVIDQGPGLSDADQAKLFRRGVRLAARPTAGESSEGNGLALAHELAVAMAGRIVCVSRLGAGAEFRMELPGDAGPRRPWSGGSGESGGERWEGEEGLIDDP
jgi:signal transduction histidine kinase